MHDSLHTRLNGIRESIRSATQRSGRAEDDVTLVAVSKTFPASDVALAAKMGQLDFGENKVQEFVQKSAEVAKAYPELSVRWHCIGHLQRNKAKEIIGKTSLFHALDSIRLGESLQQHLAQGDGFLDCLIQVNVSDEASKFGIEPGELDGFMDSILPNNRLRIRGLMTLASPAPNPEHVRPQFALLRELSLTIADRLHEGAKPALSMGMSSDFEVAIEEGATIVRVGSSIFGGRS